MEHVRESVKYLEKLSPFFTERDLEEIKTAYAFSKYGHRNQERESGERYFDHPKAVSLIIFDDFEIKFDWQVIVIALLHDIVEDQYLLTERRIYINFRNTVAQGVKFVSKDEYSKDNFFPRLFICAQWRPMIVKLADRIHNMRTLNECSTEKQRKQVKETREYYFKLCNIVEKIIPKKYRHAVAYARKELDELCKKYEAKFAVTAT
jgi:guanosine-3',5'-bis(diphosphate) 3'-pyrophosphohydrolase